jgi:hypothetical protein
MKPADISGIEIGNIKQKQTNSMALCPQANYTD